MDLVQNGFGGGVNPNGAQSGAALTNLSSVFSDLGQQQMRAVAIGQAMRAAAAQKELGSLGMASGAPDATGIATYLGNGGDPKNLADTLRLTHSLYGGVDDPIAAQAAAGGGNFAGSPLSQQRAEANTLLTQKTAADIAAASQQRIAGMEPVIVRGPNGPIYSNKASATGQTPILSTDQVKGLQLGDLFAQPGGAPPPAAPAQSASPPSGGLGSVFQAPQASMPAGGTFPMTGTGPAALAAAPQAATPAQPQMTQAQAVALGLIKPSEFGPTGEDPLTGFKSYGNSPLAPVPSNAPGAPATAAGASAAPTQIQSPLAALIYPPGSENLRGEQYLKTLEANPTLKAAVEHARAILSYDSPPLDTGNAGVKPQDAIAMDIVRHAAPAGEPGAFKDTGYDTRQKFILNRDDSTSLNSIASGSQMIDTTLEHLKGMSDTGAQLAGQSALNVPHGLNATWNAAQNAWAGPDAAKAEAAYNDHLSQAQSEAAKFFGGSSPTDAEKGHLHALFDPNLSPPERNAAIGALVQDLMARAKVMQARNDAALGPNSGYKVVSDDARKIAEHLMSLSSLTSGAAAQVGNGAAPAPLAPAAPTAQPAPMQRALSDQAQDALEAWDKSGQPPEVIAAAKTKILQRLHTGQ